MLSNDVTNIVSDFTAETGKTPRYLYLGQEEVWDLMQLTEIRNQRGARKVLYEMIVIEVFESSHLRVS